MGFANQKVQAEANERFYKFLLKEGPTKNGECTLFEDKNGKFYLVYGGISGNKTMLFVINSHFWYDYTEIYVEGGEDWKVLYKKVV
jgi:hypothetical protein